MFNHLSESYNDKDNINDYIMWCT